MTAPRSAKWRQCARAASHRIASCRAVRKPQHPSAWQCACKAASWRRGHLLAIMALAHDIKSSPPLHSLPPPLGPLGPSSHLAHPPCPTPPHAASGLPKRVRIGRAAGEMLARVGLPGTCMIMHVFMCSAPPHDQPGQHQAVLLHPTPSDLIHSSIAQQQQRHADAHPAQPHPALESTQHAPRGMHVLSLPHRRWAQNPPRRKARRARAGSTGGDTLPELAMGSCLHDLHGCTGGDSGARRRAEGALMGVGLQVLQTLVGDAWGKALRCEAGGAG